MNKLKIVLLMTVAAVLLGSACQKIANTASNTSNTASIANSNTAFVANSNTASPTNTAASDTGTTTGSPSDAYKAAYTARKNKDVPALKRMMSKDLLGFLTDMAKVDKKTLDDELMMICNEPQAATAEARNEKIDGDHATIEYKDDDGSWEHMDFVREDGSWKMDLGKDDRKEAEKLKEDRDKN